MTKWTEEELTMLDLMKGNMDLEDIAVLLPNKTSSEIKRQLEIMPNPVNTNSIDNNSVNINYNDIIEWISNEDKPFTIIDFIKDNSHLKKYLPSITKIFQDLENASVIYKADYNPNKYVTDLITQNKILNFLKKNRGQYFTTGPLYAKSGHYVPYMKLINLLEDMVKDGKISKGIIKVNSIGYRYGKETLVDTECQIKEKYEPAKCNDRKKKNLWQKFKKVCELLDKIMRS